MILLRLVCVALIVVLAGGSCWAQAQAGLWASVASIAHDPWGVMTLVDLASGFLVASLWMAWREPRRGFIPLWIIGVILLGNMVTLLFILRCSVGAGDMASLICGPRAPR
jgi:hypothetical protein